MIMLLASHGTKFNAFASDWGATLKSNVAAGQMRSDRIVVSGWEIWKGGVTSVSVQRRLVGSVEKI